MGSNTAIVLIVLIVASCTAFSGGSITVSECASAPVAQQGKEE
jgi:hypothetical protein